MIKIAIVGSREYSRLDHIWAFVDNLPDTAEIISGGARGVDSEAETAAWARAHTIIFRANWAQYGKSAGVLRNQQIVNNCDALVAFWDKKSRGTNHSIEFAKKTHKPGFVFTADTDPQEIIWVAKQLGEQP